MNINTNKWADNYIAQQCARLSFGAALASSLVAVLSAPTASAQSAQSMPAVTPSESAPEEIVVTARKHAENVQKIPESIFAITSAMISDAHITQLDDIGSLVSNLNIVQRNDNTPDVTLRGVGSFGVVQGVGFYSNDVQLFEGQTIRPEDLDRIEVLKGPQGTLFGGSNIGGAIKYVTKLPKDEFEAQATVEFGDENTKNYSAVISGPINDSLKARLSLYEDNNDGFITDTTFNETLGKTRDQGGRLTVTWDDDLTSVRFYFAVDHFHTGAQNLLYTPPNDHTYLDTIADYVHPSFHRNLYAPTLQIERHLTDDVSLTSISSYFHSYNKGITDLCKCDYPFDTLDQNAKNEVYSQELRLASTSDAPLSWMVGLFAQIHRTDTLQMDNYAPYALTFNPADLGNPTVVDNALDVESKLQHEYAIFANAKYKLDAWTLEAGIRGEIYDSQLGDRNTPTFLPVNFTLGSGKVNGAELSPKVSLSYQFEPEIMGYATIARGFEPADEIYETFIHKDQPETALSYEVGMKSTLFDKIRFNAAAFYIDYSNRLFQTIQFNNAGIFEVTRNIGDSANYGFEFDASTRLPYGFSLSGGFGLTEAKWDNVNFFDPVANAYINLKGKTAPFTPEYQGNIALEWTHPITPEVTFVARADTSFYGTSYWDPQDDYKQSPYDLFNIGARIETDDWSLAWRMTNVMNTRYNTIYDGAADIGAPFNVAHLNRPRQFVFTLTGRY